jgi:hypothetical protein
MARPALAVTLVLLASATGPGRAWSQNLRGVASVRGVTRSTLGERVPYAVVALEPGFSRRFADDSGAFAFPRVAPGRYHLLARQIGFKPLDTMVVVSPDSALVLNLALEHLVVELSEITVTPEIRRAERTAHCTAPGPPNAETAPELAAIFDQLRQNAERYWMLADSYPVLYRMARSQGSPGSMSSVDTLDLRTNSRWHYSPGHVINEARSPRGGTDVQVELPTLPDFADSVFDQVHCFRLFGLDTLDGQGYVRIDFRASERLTEPDADGSAYLDPSSYLIRRAIVQLTHPDRARAGLSSFTASVRYREIAPSLVIVDSIEAEQAGYQGAYLAHRLEVQRLVDVVFLRPLPQRR